jgi:hypothetical protein
MESERNHIINDIIYEIVDVVEKNGIKQQEYNKSVFVEQILNTITQIVIKLDIPLTDIKLKSYEYYRYNTISALLREFINQFFNNNILNKSIKDRLSGYLCHSYTQSKYYIIVKNIANSFRQQNISVQSYLTPKIVETKMTIYEYLQKQYTLLGIIQEKTILKNMNKQTLDDLFNKIIFELTIYITHFT